MLKASGSDVITAYVAGYEKWMELISREPDNHQLKGLHPTLIFGALAAAAGCSNLRRPDEGRTINALGIAAAQASGLTAVYGSMVKSAQVGRAAYGCTCGALGGAWHADPRGRARWRKRIPPRVFTPSQGGC